MVELVRDAAPNERETLEALQLRSSLVWEADAGACELEGLFVEPELMRAGVGRALVDDAAGRARAEGADRIEVTANPRALGFYERLGFRGSGTVQTRFGPGLRMRLAL